MDWKRNVIKMTQFKEAREQRIDATFFPPVTEGALSQWEKENEVALPAEWRTFYLQSNGMEAQKGVLRPLLPMEEFEVLPKSCSLENAWVQIGKSSTHRYYLNLGLSATVWRVEEFSSDSEFFAASLTLYLKAVFQGKS
ncbi:MAG: SMI1/KNR4 family protein [Verrucomicrobiales bacterium]|nr:SMI1/KNR4 family protein [Verrucomicrobiales bacterium]